MKKKKILWAVVITVVIVLLAVFFLFWNKRARLLWEIPFQTGEPGSILFYDHYGDWGYSFGLQSFCTDGDMLFIDDSANQRIQVWTREGRQDDIILDHLVCHCMRYVSEEKYLYVTAYNPDFVEPIMRYYYVDVEKDNTLNPIKDIKDGGPFRTLLDEQGEMDSTWRNEMYEDYRRTVGQLSELTGSSEDDISAELVEVWGDFFLGQCYFESEKTERNRIQPFLVDKEYKQIYLLSNEFRITGVDGRHQNRCTIYEKDGNLYLAYMQLVDENTLGIYARKISAKILNNR